MKCCFIIYMLVFESGNLPNCFSQLQCEECSPLYNDKPWRAGTFELGYPCKACSCNNHATACHYNKSIDEFPDSYDLGGGGVCDDCQDNTGELITT